MSTIETIVSEFFPESKDVGPIIASMSDGDKAAITRYYFDNVIDNIVNAKKTKPHLLIAKTPKLIMSVNYDNNSKDEREALISLFMCYVIAITLWVISLCAFHSQ